ncbi:MAG TPA: 2OG-Fe(II) oxygenase [Bacteriovoracaceae bacterium]|nr:2OG-Fe(II) oxygenase [Bacteriovoracaceae bacterium]
MIKIINSINENGWIHVPDVIKTASLTSINEFFNSHSQDFSPALVGKGNERIRVNEIRGDHTYWLDTIEPPGPFKEIINFLEELKQGLNRDLFLGLKEFECHLARYEKGSFYKKHYDRFEHDSSRAISFVFYLHEEWNPEDGGELVLFDKNEQVLKVINPLPGSFVCFLSAEFPHEVRPSLIERRSLTGWIHTKIIN